MDSKYVYICCLMLCPEFPNLSIMHILYALKVHHFQCVAERLYRQALGHYNFVIIASLKDSCVIYTLKNGAE